MSGVRKRERRIRTQTPTPLDAQRCHAAAAEQLRAEGDARSKEVRRIGAIEKARALAQRPAPILASFPRDHKNGELRMYFKGSGRFQGVNVRLWREIEKGLFLPTKQGVMINVREIDTFIDALERAKRIANGEPVSPAAQSDAKPAWLKEHHELKPPPKPAVDLAGYRERRNGAG